MGLTVRAEVDADTGVAPNMANMTANAHNVTKTPR